MMIATPCYGGQVTAHYARSMIQLSEALQEFGIYWEYDQLWNESLIQRARNAHAQAFLESDHDFLFFIDADIEFEVDHFTMLWNMMHEDDCDVAVGCYKMKKVGAPYAAWVDGELVTDLNQFTGPFDVDYAGTGFMMIRRSILEQLRDDNPEWVHEEGDGERTAFFQCPLEDGIQLSEDYFFCKRVKEAGGTILMHPECKLTHWGTFPYGAQ